MKNTIPYISLLFSFMLITIVSIGQSCLPDGITFNNQVQIDSFSYNYTGCHEIEGGVIITGSIISNLNGLSEINKINGNLLIINADSLVNLQGLNNLGSIGGQLWIGYFGPDGNMSLESISGLESLKRIGQGLTVIQNPKLENFIGFDSLSYVYDIHIGSNESLNSLIGFNSLDTVDYGLRISGTESLIDLNGLNNLSYINHNLTINGNEVLSSLSGIDNLIENSVDWFLHIYNNPNLSQCEVESICNILADTITAVSIDNNYVGCNSPEEVIQACMVSIPVSEYRTGSISIFPNPTKDKINLDFNKDINPIDIKIFDVAGKLKHISKFEPTEIDISNLDPGIYIVEIKTFNNIIRKKIIKH